MHCHAILFDLDGTLVDSTAHINRIWRSWAERNGLSFEALLPIMHGRPAPEIVRLAAPHLPVEAEAHALELQEITGMQDVRLLPGARSLLDGLPPQSWAVVTSRSRRAAAAVLQHLGLSIPQVLVTSDQVEHGKPAPDGFLHAARLLGLEPGECVVVEDAPPGLQAGKAAGMRVIAVASTHAVEDLQAADVIVAQLADLDVQVQAGDITVAIPD